MVRIMRMRSQSVAAGMVLREEVLYVENDHKH